jgi:hypothetical protein
MIRILLLSISLTVPILAAQPTTPDETAPDAKTATEAKKEEAYIPENLEDCFRELDKNLRPEDIEKIRQGEITPSDMHFGLGMGLRNGWRLWGGSRLAKYFNGIGIMHPDDMSGVILESYVRYLKKEPIKLDEQVAFYKKYWEESEKERKAQEAEEKGKSLRSELRQ